MKFRFKKKQFIAALVAAVIASSVAVDLGAERLLMLLTSLIP